MVGVAKKKPNIVPPEPNEPLTPVRIRAIRLSLDLTQAAAGKRVGITQRAWAMLEAGDRVPSAPLTILINLLAQKKI